MLPNRLRDLRYSEYNLHRHPLADKICRKALSLKALHGWDLALPPCDFIAQPVHLANAALIDYVLEQTGASVYLDASKEPVNALLMSGSPLFDVSLIWLSRDGRAWFNSVLRRHPGVRPEFAARGFVKTVRRIQRMVHKWPAKKILYVGYEDLCEDTGTIVGNIFSRMGLEPADQWSDFRRAGRHIIGNAAVLEATSTVVADPGLWREQLSKAELAIFERIAGEANRSLGYTQAI